jgi:hypothetical protein
VSGVARTQPYRTPFDLSLISNERDKLKESSPQLAYEKFINKLRNIASNLLAD